MRDEKFSKAFGKTGRFVKRFRDAWGDASESNDFGYPDVDIIDDEDELVIMIDLPGVDKDNIKLSIMKDVLEVKAEEEEDEYEESEIFMFNIPLEDAKYPALYPSVFEKYERPYDEDFFWRNGELC